MGDEYVEKLLEIVKTFPSLKISAGDLHKLSTDTVVPIYLEALKALGIDIRNLWKPLKSESQFNLSYYDKDFRFITKLHSVLTMVSKDTANLEFDLMDILKPGIRATYAVVAILYNVNMFRITRKEELAEIVKQGSEKIEKCKRMAAHQEILRDEINYQSKQKAKLSVLRDQLMTHTSDAEGRVFTLIEERENIAESLEPLSKMLAEYDNKISKPETEGIKLVQTIEKLKNQIVSSPDQLVQNLENLREAEQRKKEEQLSISDELQQKKSHFEKLANCPQVANAVSEEMKDLNKLIDEIRNEEIELKRFETEKSKLTEEVSIKKEVIGWIKHTRVDCQQKNISLKEHVANKNKEAQKKLEELDMRIAQEIKAIEESKQRWQDCAKELEEYKIKITKEKEKQNHVLLKIEKESEDVIQEVKEMIHTFNHLSQSIAELQSSEK